MAIDKVKWHAGAEGFPSDLPTRCGATHMGMFVDWARARGLLNEQLHRFSPIGARLLRCGMISGRAFILWFCDGAFSSGDHLNSIGDAFAESYYEQFLTDFEALFPEGYRVGYSRRHRARMARLLDERFGAWQASGGEAAKPQQ
jgi:hypothetical protein